jgi:hypothetical protein
LLFSELFWMSDAFGGVAGDPVGRPGNPRSNPCRLDLSAATGYYATAGTIVYRRAPLLMANRSFYPA